MSTTFLPPDLAELARAHGVATEYWDWRGVHVTVSADTIRAVLAALDVDAGNEESTRLALEEATLRPWRRMLPPVVVAIRGRVTHIPVHVTHEDPVDVWVELEDWGGRRNLEQVEKWVEPHFVGTRLVGEATFVVPRDTPLGWHTLYAETPGQAVASCRLVVVPARLELPRKVATHGASGLMNQLYSVRSRRSWGVGDLADVTELGVWSHRQLGCDFMLVNPVHAAEPQAPMEPSPYLPTTRRFVNPLYIRVEDVPEVAYLPPEDRARIEALAARARALTGEDTIDRDRAWTLKEEALRLIFARPRTAGRQAAFEAYCEAEGEGLLDFATWCAFARAHGGTADGWPAALAEKDPEAVSAAREEHAAEVEFAMWLQWLVDAQLEAAQREMCRVGMTLGLIEDLAVGVHPLGADAWALRDALARGVTVGAPPDPYNQLGQDWSQPPWRPDRLEELAYEPFRDIVRAALRHSGGLRIDHIIGLFRLWWVPSGCRPLEGTYVRYDHEAMLGILLLEAHRADALVIGEDLGTVEPWVRTVLSERGILGTSILWFEQEDDRPLPPEAYRRLCLASVTTHDLPPTAGYLSGEHLDIRERLDLFTQPVEVERAEDAAARTRMLDALIERGLLGDEVDAEERDLPAVVEALHRYVSWSPALLVGIAVADLVGDRRAINQPGTDEEYPNWRLPLAGPDRRPLLLEDVVVSRDARRLAACVRRGARGRTR